MEKRLHSLAVIIASALLAFSVVRVVERYVEEKQVISAKGIAYEIVESDSAILKVVFRVEDGNLLQKLEKSVQQQEIIKEFLIKNGLEANEIEFSQEYYNMSRANFAVVVKTKKVKELANIAKKTNELVKAGILIVSVKPSYFFTKIDEIKDRLIQASVENGRIAAQSILKGADHTKIGSLKAVYGGEIKILHELTGLEDHLGESYKKAIEVVSELHFYIKPQVFA